MALMNNLIVSWNYDTVSGSGADGTFLAYDTANTYYGKGDSFTANDTEFVFKDDLVTNKTLNFETLESKDTIEIRDDDDISISPIKKPSSMQLMFENSMFQIMSDEMINMFSTIDAYVFKFAEPYNRYKDSYDKLDEARREYFSKILSKPDLEKYLEFYKWIDSSLGYMLDQLKPASTNNQSGLMNTIESHMLERNKFKHKLPLTFQPNRNYSNSGIDIIKSNAFANSSTGDNLTDTIEDFYSTDQSINRNKNYNSIQTAGKFQNNRSGKTNDTVFQSRFSAGDGLSEKNRYAGGEEFSVYNTLNLRAKNVRKQFDLEQASTSHYSHHQKDDNNFIRFNIPYTASNYANLDSASYQQFANKEVAFRQRNNILVDDSILLASGFVQNVNYALIEPPIQFNVPVKQIINVNSSSQNLEIYSPFTNKIAFFTPYNTNLANPIYYYFRVGNPFEYLNSSITFFNKTKQFSEIVDIIEYEKLENIFPNKQFMGMAQTRTKPYYEEVEGNFQDSPVDATSDSNSDLRKTITNLTWSQNSYNNNNSEIRTFWKDNKFARRRSRGLEFVNGTGSINSINSYNLSSSVGANGLGYSWFIRPTDYFRVPDGGEGYIHLNVSSSDNNFYSSVYNFDSDQANDYPTFKEDTKYEILLQNNQYGDLTPYSIQDNSRFFIFNALRIAKPVAKPQFVNLDYIPMVFDDQTLTFNINKSYQSVDNTLKPFYNSYQDFFENIKHKSQNYSIVPEYNTSNFDISGFDSFRSDYLKLLGRESFSSFSESDNAFIVDFEKFISNDSNKIKIIFNGVKKLLPYKGFYPSDRSLQIANLFSKAYFESTKRQTSLTEYEKQALLHPFFAPGILYNTIKSGIAVEFPVITSSHELRYEDAGDRPSCFDLNDEFYSAKLVSDLDFIDAGLKKIPFESILDPQRFLTQIETTRFLSYVNATYYGSGSIILSGSKGDFSLNNRFFVPSIRLEQRLIPFLGENPVQKNNYKKSINNYLAEIPNFFLKNKFFTSFISKPESSFPILVQDINYKMNLEIIRKSNFKMFSNAPDDIYDDTYFQFERSLFGPYNLENNSVSYGPSIYCPPYIGNFDLQDSSHKTLTFTFTPTQTKKHTLGEILNGLVISSPSPTRYMTLEACLNLKQSVLFKNILFDAITSAPKDVSFTANDKAWIIQTKFECPIINYDNGLQFYTGSSVRPRAQQPRVSRFNDTLSEDGYYYVNSKEYKINGIWNSYGRIPDEGSLQLKLSDVESDYNEGGDQDSLLTALGFQPETKNLCELAESKIISEAVVILPFCNNFRSLPQDVKRECIYFSPTEGKNLFKIKKSTINSLLQVQDYTLLSITDIKKILETNPAIDSSNSIISMMKKMANYNVPPHLNWLLTPKRIEPFVMYIAEFESELSKQDLADIWQGTMPTIAQTPEEQQINLEHFIAKDQLFGYDLGTAETPIEIFKKFEIKGKVFKIKKRANNNYYKLTANTEDDDRFSTGGTDWYSYNWPYDYFSLVELVNVQAGEAKSTVPIQTVSGEPINPLTNADITRQIRDAINEFTTNRRFNIP